MRFADLDDAAPPEPDRDVLLRVRRRSESLRNRRRLRIASVVAFVVGVALGVGDLALHSRTPGHRVAVGGTAPSRPVDIAGTWTPRTVAGYAGPIDNFAWHTTPFLRFDGVHTWNGADGCNSIGGSYTLQPDGEFRTAGAEGGTLVLCSGPTFPTVAILHNTTRIERTPEQLTFIGAHGKVVATYALVPNQSQSRDWAGEVNDVRKDGRSAYVSQSIDVVKPGTYTLVFGPLSQVDDARFAKAGNVNGAVGESEADDLTFDGRPEQWNAVRVVVDGKSYLQMPYSVTAVRTRYDGFRVLLQF